MKVAQLHEPHAVKRPGQARQADSDTFEAERARLDRQRVGNAAAERSASGIDFATGAGLT